MGRLEGKVAYITGGARGMGAELARTFAAEGADIVISDICENIDTVRYDLGTKDELEAVAEEVRSLGRRCVAEVADVRSQKQLDAVTAKALQDFGKIDIVCANAGIHGVAKFTTMTEQQWDDLLGVNLTGIWKTAKSTAPSMIERQSGCFIITASVSAREPLPEYAHYTTAKHGVIGLARSLGVELGPDNVRVNTILPGPIDTYLNDNPVNRDWAAGFKGATTEDMHAAIRNWHNLRGRGALPAKAVANAALYLASDEAEHVHGAELVVDAGHLLLPGFNHSPVQPEGYPRRPNEGYNPYAD
ncbi:mycofactocin-coupled SDR family oxidoreductase [Sphaerisporangium sp. NPDC051011]|uniref:mycofactocin-coupled SDR family oxidoreductase n=1 Tax=Sphaerisporangium sp. NPDC051011 TaxID=3155792 RepID=UPI0033E9E571